MLIVLAARQINVMEYAWYRFGGKRTARFPDHHARYELELENKEVYGLKPNRKGDIYYLVDASDLSTRFKLTAKEANNLIKRSKTFRGKVGGKSVKDSLRGPRGGQDPKQSIQDAGTGVDSVQVPVGNLRHPRENYDITKKLQQVRMGGMKGVEFIQAQEMLPGEIYYFYDAASTLRSYRRVKRLRVGQYGNWAKDVERAIEKQIRGIDVEVGTVKMMGELRHIIAVVDF